MHIPPILPVSLNALQAVALGDGLREGRVLEARITQLLSNTLARLEIDGQPLVVTMTKPLPVGAVLTLKVEREAGQLKLITQGPARDMPEASLRAPSPQSASAISAEPEKTALAKFQAMTVEAMLDHGPAPERSLSQILGLAVRPPTDTALAAQLSPPPSVHPGETDRASPAMLAASGQDAPESGEPGAVRADTAEPRPVPVSPETLGAPGRTERAITSFVVDVPVFLAANDVPLRLHVTEHEEADQQDDEEPRPPNWTVRFAADPGRLGMVQAAISLIDGRIGVQLWAERAETVEQFMRHAPQLRDALQASDLTLDGISIAGRGPLGDS